jgi:hypothetical protein
MDQWATLSREEKRKLIIDENIYLQRLGVALGIPIGDEKPSSTLQPPTQLELPLEWNRHVTQEPLLKVSEPCISPMPYLL